MAVAIPAAPSPNDQRGQRGVADATWTRTRALRTVLVALGGASLLMGLNAGLVRLGTWAPLPSARLGDIHGPVMVLGFLGTLISLERAQALRNPLAYVAPGLLGLGSLVLVSGASVLGKLLLLEGALAFVGVALALWRRAPLPLVAAQALGAMAAALAAGLWLVVDVAALLPLLVAFLVVTIAAERAELAQLSMGRAAVPTLVVLSSSTVVSATACLVWPEAAGRVLGACLLATALWLFRDDVGRRMIRSTGLRRFNAAALLGGNFWLAASGAVLLVVGRPIGVAAYDMVVHGTFLGFGISMVMAHAPIIFPAVLGRPLPYTALMWVPLALLHAGMVVRFAGDLSGVQELFRFGGVVGVVALLAFAVTAVASAVRA